MFFSGMNLQACGPQPAGIHDSSPLQADSHQSFVQTDLQAALAQCVLCPACSMPVAAFVHPVHDSGCMPSQEAHATA